MSTAEFKLTGVWRLRKATRDERRLALADVLARLGRVADELTRIAAELEQFQRRRRDATEPGIVRLPRLQGDLAAEESLRTERQRFWAEQADLEQELLRRQDELREAETEWRAIEWLRQRRG